MPNEALNRDHERRLVVLETRIEDLADEVERIDAADVSFSRDLATTNAQLRYMAEEVERMGRDVAAQGAQLERIGDLVEKHFAEMKERSLSRGKVLAAFGAVMAAAITTIIEQLSRAL